MTFLKMRIRTFIKAGDRETRKGLGQKQQEERAGGLPSLSRNVIGKNEPRPGGVSSLTSSRKGRPRRQV